MAIKKILIADDHAMIRKGVELLLKASFPTTEIIEACNGNEVIALNHLHKPDILLLDYNMPEMNGYDAAHLLLKSDKNLKIILFTMFDTMPVALNFLKTGGKGFIWKGGSPSDISDGIRAVAKGDYYFSSVYEKDMGVWLRQGISQTLPRIKYSPLDLQILVQISKGKTSVEIAKELNLSMRTVETYRYDLLKKSNVKNSMELMEYIFRNGIV